MTKTRRAELAALVAKASPTGGAVHVPSVMGEDEAERKKKRRRQLGKLLARRGEEPYTLDLDKRMAIAKADDPGRYVGRMLVNADLLAAWWARVRAPAEPEAIDPNPHLTVAYSRVDFPWTIDRTWLFITPEQIIGVGLLGPKNALVLFLESPILESRWAAANAAGASWDHDGYHPHMTIAYLGAAGDGWTDRARGPLPLPDFPLVFGPELSSPRGVDVFEAVKAPDWYQDSRGVSKGHQPPVHVHVTMPAQPAPVVNLTVEAPRPTNKRGTIVRDPNGGAPTVEITEVEAVQPSPAG